MKAVEALTAAVKANDTGLLLEVLASHPELKPKLNEPLPGYGFDAPALMGAVNHKNLGMIDALLQAGADINARTKWWAGSFGVLDGCDNELASQLIERGAYVDVHAAARLGFFDRLKELIEADPSLVKARGGDGQTPLHFASTVEIAHYLLDHGADIDTRDIDHESTAAQYMVSVRPRRTAVAHYLISRGAKTDLLMAASLGDLQLVRRHLDSDPASIHISVSEKDFPKQNPHSGGSIYIYGFGWGKTPHMLAREFGHEDVFQLLMERSPLALQLGQACDVGDEALANEIAAKHPDVASTLPPEAQRRVVSAAMRNDATAVRLLLLSGWPAFVEGDNGQTPLHWAAWHGNVAMVRELLLHHAPLDAREREYKGSPLDWALHGSKNGWHRDTGDYEETVRVLMEAGAK